MIIAWHFIGFVFGFGWYKLLAHKTIKFGEGAIKDGRLVIWPVTISFPIVVEILMNFSGVTGVLSISDIAGEMAYSGYLMVSGVSLIFWLYAILITVGIVMDSILSKGAKATLGKFFAPEKPANYNYNELTKRDSKISKEQGVFLLVGALAIYFLEGFRLHVVVIAAVFWVILLATRWDADTRE